MHSAHCFALAISACLLLAPVAARGQTAPAAPSATPILYEKPQVEISGAGAGNSSMNKSTVALFTGFKTLDAALASPLVQRQIAGASLSSYLVTGGIHGGFHQPPAYLVECFFVVKPVRSKPLLYSAVSIRVNGPDITNPASGKFIFTAPKFALVYLALPEVAYKFDSGNNPDNSGPSSAPSARSTTVTDVTFVTFNPPPTPTPSPGRFTDKRGDRPIDEVPVGGWIVRIFDSEGSQLLYVGGSDDGLIKSAALNRRYFDKAYDLLRQLMPQSAPPAAPQ